MNNPVIDEYGNKCWYNDEGHLHRTDGPAIECSSGSKYWFINGKSHREDGPAIESSDGEGVWYYDNELVGVFWEGFTQEDFERYLKIKEYW